MEDKQKILNSLFTRLNWDAQDTGMIRLRNAEIGGKLQIRCTALWKEVINATEPTEDLINRLTVFHNDVEKAAKETGLYKWIKLVVYGVIRNSTKKSYFIMNTLVRNANIIELH
nr:hypothetical protein [Providencia sp. PROV024]